MNLYFLYGVLGGAVGIVLAAPAFIITNATLWYTTMLEAVLFGLWTTLFPCIGEGCFGAAATSSVLSVILWPFIGVAAGLALAWITRRKQSSRYMNSSSGIASLPLLVAA